MLTKAEFYAKHRIENNTLMPQSFNAAECQRVFSKIYNERYNNNAELVQNEIKNLMALLKQNMMPPEQYDGFYPPKDKIVFYNAAHKNNVMKLELSPQDINDLDLTVTDEMIQKWHMGMTTQLLEKEGFHTVSDTAKLVARAGDNIYLTGFYTDCGTSECPIKIMVKEQGEWHSRKSDIFFAFCAADENKSAYECNLVGGDNSLWHYVADYAPLTDLSDRYYMVWKDYIEQYLQNVPD